MDAQPAASTTYQGWSNYMTWCANLWLTNEEPSYNALRRCTSGADIKAFVHRLVATTAISEASWRGFMSDLAANAATSAPVEAAFSLNAALETFSEASSPATVAAARRVLPVIRALAAISLQLVDWNEIYDNHVED